MRKRHPRIEYLRRNSANVAAQCHHALRCYVHKLATSKNMRRLHLAAYTSYYGIASLEDKGARLIAICALVAILVLHHIDTELSE